MNELLSRQQSGRGEFNHRIPAVADFGSDDRSRQLNNVETTGSHRGLAVGNGVPCLPGRLYSDWNHPGIRGTCDSVTFGDQERLWMRLSTFRCLSEIYPSESEVAEKKCQSPDVSGRELFQSQFGIIHMIHSMRRPRLLLLIGVACVAIHLAVLGFTGVSPFSNRLELSFTGFVTRDVNGNAVNSVSLITGLLSYFTAAMALLSVACGAAEAALICASRVTARVIGAVSRRVTSRARCVKPNVPAEADGK